MFSPFAPAICRFFICSSFFDLRSWTDVSDAIGDHRFGKSFLEGGFRAFCGDEIS
jgi:hypothetical protein